MKKVTLVLLTLLIASCATRCPIKSSQVNPSSDYSYCDFSGRDLKKSDFTNSNLSYAQFNSTDIRGAKFNGSELTNSDFRYANAEGANFKGAWAGNKSGNYVTDNVGFYSYKTDFIGSTWFDGSTCSYKSIGTCIR